MKVYHHKELIKLLVIGDEAAYGVLLETYHKRLYAYALSLVRNPSSAQDIVQNVFINTWNYREKLNPDLSLQHFLYRSVYNTFINHHQKQKSNMLLQYKYFEALQNVVEESNEEDLNRMIEIVNKAINNLPPKCREIFILSKKDGLVNSEISEYLNISIKTVEGQLTKAFRILRTKLGKEYEAIMLVLLTIKI